MQLAGKLCVRFLNTSISLFLFRRFVFFPNGSEANSVEKRSLRQATEYRIL